MLPFGIGNFMGLEAGNYTVQLRCFSAPFFQKYDKDKINELNYGGKVLVSYDFGGNDTMQCKFRFCSRARH